MSTIVPRICGYIYSARQRINSATLESETRRAGNTVLRGEVMKGGSADPKYPIPESVVFMAAHLVRRRTRADQLFNSRNCRRLRAPGLPCVRTTVPVCGPYQTDMIDAVAVHHCVNSEPAGQYGCRMATHQPRCGSVDGGVYELVRHFRHRQSPGTGSDLRVDLGKAPGRLPRCGGNADFSTGSDRRKRASGTASRRKKTRPIYGRHGSPA